jgi:hypothetical protein
VSATRAGAGLHLALDQRAFVCGRTGTGKSYFSRRWIRDWRSGIAVDHKHNGIPPAELPGWEVAYGFRAALEAWGAEHPRIIVRPAPGDTEESRAGGRRVPSLYELLALRVLAAGWTGWYDDEVANVAPLGKLNPGLERLYGEGRARAVPVVVATQRPIGIHNKLLSEADHIVVFQLQLEGDRAKLASFAGAPLMDPQLLAARHSFAHFRADTGELQVYGAIR